MGENTQSFVHKLIFRIGINRESNPQVQLARLNFMITQSVVRQCTEPFHLGNDVNASFLRVKLYFLRFDVGQEIWDAVNVYTARLRRMSM